MDLKLTDGPSGQPDLQAQESIKAFALFASQKLQLNESELVKKMQAKADDDQFIKLLRENSWKSRGKDMKLIKRFGPIEITSSCNKPIKHLSALAFTCENSKCPPCP